MHSNGISDRNEVWKFIEMCLPAIRRVRKNDNEYPCPSWTGLEYLIIKISTWFGQTIILFGTQ